MIHAQSSSLHIRDSVIVSQLKHSNMTTNLCVSILKLSVICLPKVISAPLCFTKQNSFFGFLHGTLRCSHNPHGCQSKPVTVLSSPHGFFLHQLEQNSKYCVLYFEKISDSQNSFMWQNLDLKLAEQNERILLFLNNILRLQKLVLYLPVFLDEKYHLI